MVKEEKHINWCDQSRLLGANIFVKNLAIITSSYCYNAVIERVWKITGAVEQMTLNGTQQMDVAMLTNKTLYTSSYMVATDQHYTKHYFAESQRIASRIGGGFALSSFNPVDDNNNLSSITDAPSTNEYYEMHRDSLMDYIASTSECFGFVISPTMENYNLNSIEDLQNSNNSEDDLYFNAFSEVHSTKENHSDHPIAIGIGSASFITDASGEAVQHLQYLPFGESFVSQTSSSWESPYTFSGKEKMKIKLLNIIQLY